MCLVAVIQRESPGHNFLNMGSLRLSKTEIFFILHVRCSVGVDVGVGSDAARMPVCHESLKHSVLLFCYERVH